MKLSKMKKEDLELYSYIDLTKMMLEEEKKPLNTPTIFKRICELLEMTDDQYAEKIGDFYTSLTTDKSFILLEDGNWDLRDHHSVDLILDDEEELEEDYEEDVIEEDNAPIEDDLGDGDEEDSMNDLDGDDDEEDEEDLTVISEEELEEE